jgi:hypothetical protein
VVGIIQLLNNFGVYTVLVLNMINIFNDAKSSFEPELAPVFVSIVQVNFSEIFMNFIKTDNFQDNVHYVLINKNVRVSYEHFSKLLR